ncbi:helix-turn-helix transcriptional regulator [Tateyamaria pelophila]|uniref:helix-turn-helix transcriptional regulator n=1 Tax=Tateyamaria pelophila TaxID=328415 RepID=UPI001CBC1B79|nr:helix-turn-helix transcriptional regulator [Tateyamaria pelophila]
MTENALFLGVTPTHLTQACKAATGKTAADLLTERVLYAARIALLETSVPVQDVARFLGFGSAAYFTRFIQQHTKMTPTALRRSRASDAGAVRS